EILRLTIGPKRETSIARDEDGESEEGPDGEALALAPQPERRDTEDHAPNADGGENRINARRPGNDGAFDRRIGDQAGAGLFADELEIGTRLGVARFQNERALVSENRRSEVAEPIVGVAEVQK